MHKEYLQAVYSSRKSFYKKAIVLETDKGAHILYSYGTPIVGIMGGDTVYPLKLVGSYTTGRHVDEFTRQYLGYPLDTSILASMQKSLDIRTMLPSLGFFPSYISI